MGWRHYDDVGSRYEFCMVDDDTLKKDMNFINFSTRVLRRICMDLKIPVDKIGFGKWGGGTYEMSEEDIEKIKNHASYKGLVEATKVFTYGKFDEDSDELCYFINKYNDVRYGIHELEISEKESKRIWKEFWEESKEDLSEELFKRLKKWSEKE